MRPPVKPPAPAPTPAPEPKKEPTEPDAYLFRRAVSERRMLRICMMNGSTLQARLVGWGRWSVCVDIIYHNAEKCPEEQRGVVSTASR
jgi:hypothetical protein